MAVNDSYVRAQQSVASGGDLIVSGSASSTNAAEVVEMGGTKSANIYKETDIDGDGTFEVSVQVDSTTGEWHTQLNQLTVSQSQNHRLRINNSSNNAGDYYATGIEVND